MQKTEQYGGLNIAGQHSFTLMNGILAVTVGPPEMAWTGGLTEKYRIDAG